jgi:hypothetical protein
MNLFILTKCGCPIWRQYYTLPMNTAAFASMRSVYEFFFVPLHQLWAQFDQFITGMTDFHSSANKQVLGGKCPTSVPYFDLSSLFQDIHEEGQGDDIDDLHYSRESGCYRLLDLLGYSRVYDSFCQSYPATVSGLKNNVRYRCNPFRILAYNKIYQDYYRNTNYESFDTDSFNIDKYAGGELPQGFMYSILKLRYRNAQVDYYTNLRPSLLFSTLDSIPRVDQLSFGESGEELFVTNPDIPQGYYDSLAILNDSTNDTTALSVNSIRSAFAVDKLLSVTSRPSKRRHRIFHIDLRDELVMKI